MMDDKEDLSTVLESLDAMAAMIQKIRDTLPGDSAEEQADAVDESTSEEEMEHDDTESIKPSAGGDKEMKKAAMVAMIRKNLG